MAQNRNIVISATKYLALDLVGDILYFPLWWYSAGLKMIIGDLYLNIKQTGNNLALPLLLSSMFKPMFGQYDRTGRIISFFIRLVILIFRSIFFIAKALVLLVLLILWLVIPILAVVRLKDILIHIYG